MDTETGTPLVWWKTYGGPKGQRRPRKKPTTGRQIAPPKQHRGLKASASCIFVKDLCSRSPISDHNRAESVRERCFAANKIGPPMGRAKPIVRCFPFLDSGWLSNSARHYRSAAQDGDSDLLGRELQRPPPLRHLQLFREFTRSRVSRYFSRSSQDAQQHDTELDNVALLEKLSDDTVHSGTHRSNVPESQPIRQSEARSSDHHGGSGSFRKQHHHAINNGSFLQSRSYVQLQPSGHHHTTQQPTSSPQDIEHEVEHLDHEITTSASMDQRLVAKRLETTVPQAVQAVNTQAELEATTKGEKRSRRPDQQDNLNRAVSQSAMARHSNLIDSTLTVLVSKWLSFGRMLFSPVHLQAGVQLKCKLLVIDSLGDDWAHHCSLTYPSADIAYLAFSDDRTDTSTYSNRASHRLRNLNCPFPFRENHFDAVVLRFPTVMSGSKLRHLVAECTRVLNPEGFLEISCLDLDLCIVGSRTRRALRSMKTRMRAVQHNVSLKPVSDSLPMILGHCGFENLRRCVVGVPCYGDLLQTGEGRNEETNDVLEELLDESNTAADKTILQMVAQVARRWYASSYEMVSGTFAGISAKTMWDDDMVMEECEKLGTSFKLFLCYVQKPKVAKRRAIPWVIQPDSSQLPVKVDAFILMSWLPSLWLCFLFRTLAEYL